MLRSLDLRQTFQAGKVCIGPFGLLQQTFLHRTVCTPRQFLIAARAPHDVFDLWGAMGGSMGEGSAYVLV